MKKARNITISPEIMAKAEDLMRRGAYPTFSGLVEQLIRDEWDRRFCGELPPRANPPGPGGTNPTRAGGRIGRR